VVSEQGPSLRQSCMASLSRPAWLYCPLRRLHDRAQGRAEFLLSAVEIMVALDDRAECALN